MTSSLAETPYQVMPDLSPDEYAALKGDIAARGVLVPVELDEAGNILDGHHRVKAWGELRAESVGVPDYPRIVRVGLSEADKRTHARQLNYARRHLSQEARRELIREQLKETPEKSDRQIAKALGVSDKTVGAQREVLAQGAEIPHLTTTKGADGKEYPRQVKPPASIYAPNERAEKQARKDIASVGADVLASKLSSGEAKSVVDAKRQAARARVKEAPILEGRYRVIYADPPWQYGNNADKNYSDQDKHYPTMSLDDLCAMPVRELAEDNAVLFLWVTSPILEDAFKLINAWGFNYKSSFVWDKVRHNWGNYNSVRHEFLLVCTRGSCLPEATTLYDSVVSIERTTRHSEKPEEFRGIIDALYPSGSRIELFSRTEADGWVGYGNELP